MNLSKGYSLLGFCAKARKCRMGSAVSEALVKAGECHLLLVSDGLSRQSLKKLTSICASNGVAYIVIPDGEGALGKSVGRPEAMTVAVTDQEFAKTLYQAFDIHQ